MVGSLVATAIWTMIPAYVPNNAAVLAGGGRPIDGGRTWDGTRILGDGKTWRGTAVGTITGVVLALLLNRIRAPVVEATGIELLPEFTLPAAVALALGAMLGDIGASFVKRRSGRERGASFPGLDQLDFVVGALGLTLVVTPEWFFATFTPGVIAVIVVVTPLLHVVTNVAAYKLGLKNEPW
ncbi:MULTISPECIES: CDP-2,3-bis-(O-geranylgeranyl)-sn-glycerol synthase [unclassified Haloparvum]|uniref:CDP-2,3-bis-(O-geranylgeranyl)-sn-glycerol synthase n=1 Tax=Haloparvum sp. PAK95 TaxID=3418962 RepID=UPI003D2F03A6